MTRLAVCVLCLALVSAVGGCSWMGRTAGKAQAKIERKADDLEQGYQKGYGEEKAKGGKRQESTASPDEAQP